MTDGATRVGKTARAFFGAPPPPQQAKAFPIRAGANEGEPGCAAPLDATTTVVHV